MRRTPLLTACTIAAMWAAPDAMPQAHAQSPVFGSAFDVIDFGAIPDDGLDDTAAVQIAVDTAAAFGSEGGTVIFPAGTYEVTNVYLQPGITLEGYGATLLLGDDSLDPRNPPPVGSAKWMQILRTDGPTRYSADVDSAPLTVRGLTFDGNRQAFQDIYTDELVASPYALQQQQMLSLGADPARAGRLVVRVEDCVFREGFSDGIGMRANAAVSVKSVRAHNVFRGALVVTGGHSEVQVHGLVDRGQRLDIGGETVDFAGGIDIEVDSAGFAGSHRVDVQVSGMLLGGDLDVSVEEGSRFIAHDVIVERGPINLHAPGSTVKISQCHMGGTTLIRSPFDMTLTDCTFTASTLDPYVENGTRPPAGLRVLWLGQSGWTDQHVRVVRPRFELDQTVLGDARAIDLMPTKLVEANHFTVEGGDIPAAFSQGVVLEQGGLLTVRDMAIDAAQATYLGATVDYDHRVLLQGIRYGENVVDAFANNQGFAGSLVEHREIELDVEQAGLTSIYGRIDDSTYRGRRIIRVDGDPGSLSCLRGDIARNRQPTQGAGYEWVCVQSGINGTWRPLSGVQ